MHGYRFKTCKMSAGRKANEKAYSIILHRKHRFQQKVGAGTRGMEGRVSHEYVLYSVQVIKITHSLGPNAGEGGNRGGGGELAADSDILRNTAW